ncbi:DUF3899 domain-containing protein [Peribacillus saganii]|uniref:DUF3899 domain-containing protein n=1 Tax=Peribacillus saganii TaxID=2303992 RepID=A0A372LLU3_9BACI|nr:DUF3899 domain-containing protein [Peribacillus saganii]RFU68027.1 DUF3899 domain-containing protein [Peribacillus saganii]
MIKVTAWTGIWIVVAITASLILYKSISLIHFIDIMFYISGALLMFSLLTMVVRKGFFDTMFYSFRKVFGPQKIGGNLEEEEIPLLSNLIGFEYLRTFMVGLALLAVMLAALFIYYLR